MRKSILSAIIILSVLFIPGYSFSQQFYFPHTLYSDSNALYKEIPRLARQIITVYKDSNKTTYYDNAFRYQLAAGDYSKSLELIDSSRKYNEDRPGSKMIAFQSGSYAYAKKLSMNDSASFKQVYQKAFPDLYNGLTNYEKISTESNFDTTNIKEGAKDFNKIIDTLRNRNSDSISLKDAQLLTKNYVSYIVSKTVIPLARPFLDNTTLKMKYPLIKSSKWSGVAPVANVDEVPDPNIQYNLLMEIVSGIQNKQDTFNINNINGGFSEIGRSLNLHIASGVPKKNMHIVAVVHAAAIYSLLNNENYKKKYNVDNPNLALLKELQNAGVKFIACGQAMYFFNVEKEQMIPGVKISLTAQTVLSSYQLKNYVHYTF